MSLSPSDMTLWRVSRCIVLGALLLCPLGGYAAAPPAGSSDDLSEILVQASEPRFVAPTTRDQIGRIWAPVWINGRGPYRMVLDTGANHSGVTSQIAEILGIPLDGSPPVLLRGVTGLKKVPTIRVDTLTVGDLI